MRFEGICYRAHDPRWSFLPLSGEGAAIRGARFNPKGVPTLYLSLTIMGAVKEANQGFAHKIEPCVLCCYDVDCDDVADLQTPEGLDAADIERTDLACPWMSELSQGRRPRSWRVHERLSAAGAAGVLVPSFAPGADRSNVNLVLWRWSEERPYRVLVVDRDGRLPRDQRSWS